MDSAASPDRRLRPTDARHFQNGFAASSMASCRVLPISLRKWSSSSDKACRCRDRSEHSTHQRRNRSPHPSRRWLDAAASVQLMSALTTTDMVLPPDDEPWSAVRACLPAPRSAVGAQPRTPRRRGGGRRSTARSCRASVRLRERTAIRAVAGQAAGARPPCIGPSTFQPPDARKRSGMMEGPIYARSISPMPSPVATFFTPLSGVETRVRRSICAAAAAPRQSVPFRSPHIQA